MKKLILVVCAVLGMATTAHAIPALQLDIVGGTYDTNTQTLVAPENVFTLNALLVPDARGDNLATDVYYISAAVIPRTVASGNYGSFIFNGVTYRVTDDMNFGVPPLAVEYPDLPLHGVFPDYYKEIPFTFVTTQQYAQYNSQDYPGTTPVAGTGMYVRSFNVDLSGLADGIGIHFDLYNENLITKRRQVVTYDTEFAPFSHDAEGSNTPVPEPGTIVLLGVGFLGLALYGRKRMQN